MYINKLIMKYVTLTVYYMRITKFLINYYCRIRRMITNTKSIMAINENGQHLTKLYPRYLIIRSINNIIKTIEYFMNMLVRCRDMLDISANKIQIIKDYDDGELRIIIDSSQLDGSNSIGIMEAMDRVDAIKLTDNKLMNRTIVLKFEIYVDGCDPICMKDYLIKYKDDYDVGHPTIRNIMIFNDINVDPNSNVLIRYSKNSKIKNRTIQLSDILNSRIGTLFDN